MSRTGYCQGLSRLFLLLCSLYFSSLLLLCANRDKSLLKHCGCALGVQLLPSAKFVEQLSLVTIPKPQTHKSDVRVSILVLSAWLSLSVSKVILASKKETYDPQGWVLPTIFRVFGESRVRFAGDLGVGYGERPLIREWFNLGVREVTLGYLCFLNADIVPSGDWFRVAMRAVRTLDSPSSTIIFGTRTEVRPTRNLWTLNISDPLYRYRLESYLRESQWWNNPWGMDVVLFHSSFRALKWELFPDFVVGMCVWDNYFQGWANRNCQTVSMDFYPMVFHLSHGANACNQSNLKHFRSMARCALSEAPHHYAKDAVWHLDYRANTLRNRLTGANRLLVP